MQIDKINLEQKFELIQDYWNPRIAGELNGQYVKLVKFQGDFMWHHHDLEDEMFLVVKGVLRMELRDRTVIINPGEFIIIPRGLEHRPCAENEVEVILFEPATTLNTGNLINEKTREQLEKI
jgi:mannose-6-phosphate isomerase-like protein (cupin superfamily)